MAIRNMSAIREAIARSPNKTNEIPASAVTSVEGLRGPRLYDAFTDGFLRERPEIIDRLVEMAAAILTHTERSAHHKPWNRAIYTVEARGLLRRALGHHAYNRRDREALFWLVRDLWRAQVIA